MRSYAADGGTVAADLDGVDARVRKHFADGKTFVFRQPAGDKVVAVDLDGDMKAGEFFRTPRRISIRMRARFSVDPP